jgi:hypothetical protein
MTSLWHGGSRNVDGRDTLAGTPHNVQPGMMLVVHTTTRENVMMQRMWAGERDRGCHGGQLCLLLSLTTTLPEGIGAAHRRLLTIV